MSMILLRDSFANMPDSPAKTLAGELATLAAVGGARDIFCAALQLGRLLRQRTLSRPTDEVVAEAARLIAVHNIFAMRPHVSLLSSHATTQRYCR